MTDIQPSFFQWRKKVNGALAVDAKSVTITFTAHDGRVYSIEPEELQSPQQGTYTARLTDGAGKPQEVSADYDPAPERPVRRSPEDALIARYERMADDMEHARKGAEARAQASEAEKLAALERVAALQRRVLELDTKIAELEAREEGVIDADTAGLILELLDLWEGTSHLRDQLGQLIAAIENDPRARDRIVRRAPDLIAELVRLAQSDEEG